MRGLPVRKPAHRCDYSMGSGTVIGARVSIEGPLKAAGRLNGSTIVCRAGDRLFSSFRFRYELNKRSPSVQTMVEPVKLPRGGTEATMIAPVRAARTTH